MLDETTIARIDQGDVTDLPERAEVALRFAHCIIEWPRGLTPALRAHLHEHFSREEIIELALDVLAWSYQKIKVALGVDALSGEAVTSFEIAADGRVERP